MTTNRHALWRLVTRIETMRADMGVNSNGTPYSEVSKDKLSYMATAIQKKINAFDPALMDEEQQAELEYLQLKLDAAKFYMEN